MSGFADACHQVGSAAELSDRLVETDVVEDIGRPWKFRKYHAAFKGLHFVGDYSWMQVFAVGNFEKACAAWVELESQTRARFGAHCPKLSNGLQISDVKLLELIAFDVYLKTGCDYDMTLTFINSSNCARQASMGLFIDGCGSMCVTDSTVRLEESIVP